MSGYQEECDQYLPKNLRDEWDALIEKERSLAPFWTATEKTMIIVLGEFRHENLEALLGLLHVLAKGGVHVYLVHFGRAPKGFSEAVKSFCGLYCCMVQMEEDLELCLDFMGSLKAEDLLFTEIWGDVRGKFLYDLVLDLCQAFSGRKLLDLGYLRSRAQLWRYRDTKNLITLARAQRLFDLESMAIDFCDGIFVNTKIDKLNLKGLGYENVEIELIPRVQVASSPKKPFSERDHICFLGDFELKATVEALEHFLENEFLELLEHSPKTQLHIFLKKEYPYQESWKDYENVFVRMDLEDLSEYRLCYAPKVPQSNISEQVNHMIGLGCLVISETQGLVNNMKRRLKDGELWYLEGYSARMQLIKNQGFHASHTLLDTLLSSRAKLAIESHTWEIDEKRRLVFLLQTFPVESYSHFAHLLGILHDSGFQVTCIHADQQLLSFFESMMEKGLSYSLLSDEECLPFLHKDPPDYIWSGVSMWAVNLLQQVKDDRDIHALLDWRWQGKPLPNAYEWTGTFGDLEKSSELFAYKRALEDIGMAHFLSSSAELLSLDRRYHYLPKYASQEISKREYLILSRKLEEAFLKLKQNLKLGKQHYMTKNTKVRDQGFRSLSYSRELFNKVIANYQSQEKVNLIDIIQLAQQSELCEGLISFFKAQQKFFEGDLGAARMLYQEASKGNLFFSMAEKFMEHGNDREALPGFDLYLDLAAGITSGLALLDNFDGNFESAIDLFKETSKLLPFNRLAIKNRIGIELRLGTLSSLDKLDSYQRMLTLNRKDPKLLLEYAISSFECGDSEKAIQFANQAVKNPAMTKSVYLAYTQLMKEIKLEWSSEDLLETNLDESGEEVDGDLDKRLGSVRWRHKGGLYQKYYSYCEILKEKKEPKISVILVSWNLNPITVLCLKHLERERHLNYELIFVDNGAGKGHFDLLRPYIDIYVRLNANTGVCISRNIGALHASSDLLFFMDDDALPGENFLRAHLEMREKYEIIAMRGKILPLNQSVFNEPRKNIYAPGDQSYARMLDLESGISITRKSFFAAEGWDDQTFIGAEAVDLALRLLAYDPDMRKQVYCPESYSYHDYAVTAEEYEEKNQRILKSQLRIAWRGIDANLVKQWQMYEMYSESLIKNSMKQKIDHLFRVAHEKVLDKALEALEDAVKLAPLNGKIHAEIAKGYFEKSSLALAIKHLELSVALAPHSREIIIQGMSIYQELGLYDDAKRVGHIYLAYHIQDKELVSALSDLELQHPSQKKRVLSPVYDLERVAEMQKCQ